MATVKLTKRVVDGVETPSSGQVFVWDSELKGFGFCVQKSGVRSYVVRYRVRGSGRDRRVVIGRHGPFTVQQARQEALRILSEAGQGRDPVAARDSLGDSLTVAALGALYLVDYAKRRHKDEGREAQRKLERDIYPLIGRLRVEDVSQGDAERVHREVTKQGGVQANRTLALLSGLFKFAEKRGLRPQGTNPCKYVDRNPERGRERFLTDTELRAYFLALGKVEKQKPRTALACDALRVMLLTGARKTEILSLRWEHVDFQRGIAFLPDSKTGRRPLILPEPVMVILKRMKRLDLHREWVFPGSGQKGYLTEVRVTHALACDLAKPPLKELRIHDLRHSFASVAVAGGHSLQAIGKALGHRRAVTTERYSHLGDDPVRHAVETTGKHIAGLMEDSRES